MQPAGDLGAPEDQGRSELFAAGVLVSMAAVLTAGMEVSTCQSIERPSSRSAKAGTLLRRARAIEDAS